MKVYVGGIALYTPRIPDWSSFRNIVNGAAAVGPAADMERYQPQRLPRNERRRATPIARLCFRVLEDLADTLALDPAGTPSVFASSGGDYDVVHRISSALAEDEKHISPTDFHNSVHNAAAGYWSIATGCHEPSTSLSAGDDTLPVGLLEAIMLAHATNKPTLLVAYDIAPPGPLSQARRITTPLGLAMLLTPHLAADEEDGLCMVVEPVADVVDDAGRMDWSDVAPGNPIARGLPLLEVLAVGRGQIHLGGTMPLRVTVSRGAEA